MKKVLALFTSIGFLMLLVLNTIKAQSPTLINAAKNIPITSNVNLKIANWNFELGNLNTWTAEGNSFTQPTFGEISVQKIDNWQSLCWDRSMPNYSIASWNHGIQGNYWLSSGDNRPNNSSSINPTYILNTQGTLTSAEFTTSQNIISFLMCGKSSKKCAVELMIENDGSIPATENRIYFTGEKRVVGTTEMAVSERVTFNYKPIVFEGKNYMVVSSKINTNDANNDNIIQSSVNYEPLNQVRFKRVQFFVDEKFRNKKARIRIIDNDENGYISVDDFKFENTLSPQPNIRIAINPTDCPLKGFVDMHTHVMSHLAFGGKVMNGAPDEQTLMLGGTMYKGGDIGNISNCEDSLRPGSIARALSRCDAIHGGVEPNNNCGDVIRATALEDMDALNTHFGDKNDGYPDFKYWPSQQSILHQQMWYEWVKRAYSGGMRVMVSLSVNNSLLAKIVNGNQPQSDKESSELQIREMKAFVARHNDFMEIANTPDDLKRIVGIENKLAIILGIEVDDIGNFSRNQAYNNITATQANIDAELQSLYNQGIRYIFPIHLSNNIFGGTAVNINKFALISKYITNKFIDVEQTNTGGVNVILKYENFETPGFDGLRSRDLGYIVDNQKTYDSIGGYGHINALGLTDLGKSTLQKMMKMGFIIDIDHMGRKAMQDAINVSINNRNYPLNTGHNEMIKARGTERNLNLELVQAIKTSGGMIGTSSSNALPSEFAQNYTEIYNYMGNKNVAIGTDANGFEPLPKASPRLDSYIFYRDAGLTKQVTGNRTWDYTKDGVAHYGLMPEFIFDVSRQRNGQSILYAMQHNANDFLLMWQKTITTAALIR